VAYFIFYFSVDFSKESKQWVLLFF